MMIELAVAYLIGGVCTCLYVGWHARRYPDRSLVKPLSNADLFCIATFAAVIWPLWLMCLWLDNGKDDNHI
jgi:hypothetical protein